MTVSIIVTTRRRGTSKKAKTKELTSQATSKGTRAINIDKRLRVLSVLYAKESGLSLGVDHRRG